MSVFIFLIILGVLIFVHELGHFLVAKKSGIKVDEFAIGFPPKIWSKKVGETVYSVNAVPFGGFVKIVGEDPSVEAVPEEERSRNFAYKSKWIQTAVLGAGVAFNIIFAWILISVGSMVGLPTPVSEDPERIVNPKLTIIQVSQLSPADRAGIKPGDVISTVSSEGNVLEEISPQGVSNFIEAHSRDEIFFEINRGEQGLEFALTPEEGIISGRSVVGVSMDMIGTLKLLPHEAFWEAGKTTVNLVGLISVGLFDFIKDAFTGQGGFSQITGPVGIVGLVGDVSQLGIIYLLSFTAFISINLAIINLLPFPALDGGRILFVIIEAIKGSPIKPQIANTLNGLGFVLLILLMVAVTINDIIKLF